MISPGYARRNAQAQLCSALARYLEKNLARLATPKGVRRIQSLRAFRRAFLVVEGLMGCESDAVRCGAVGCVAMRFYAGDLELETSRVCHHQTSNGKSRLNWSNTMRKSMNIGRKSVEKRSRGPSETPISVPLPVRAPSVPRLHGHNERGSGEARKPIKLFSPGAAARGTRL